MQLSASAFDYVTKKQTPTNYAFGQPQAVVTASQNRIVFTVPVVDHGGKLRNAIGFPAVYQDGHGRRSSTTGGTSPVTRDNYFLSRLSWFLGIPPALDQNSYAIDELAARYIFEYPFHPARQPKLHSIVQSLKTRSENNFDTFMRLLFELDGAYRTSETNSILQVTHPLILKTKPTVVNPDQSLRGLNAAYDFTLNGADRKFSFPLAESLHPTNGLTKLTAADTATFTRFDGLDHDRPLFAVVSFEGVMSVSGDGKLYFRVGAHLLRFVLLDVDGSMPRFSTPSRDSSNNHAIDDFDD